jgi:hypothetical protein
VYTSREWKKARQYAIPHQLPGSQILTKVVALFVIPGASGEGGTAAWKKKKMSVHKQVDGKWQKRPEWFLVPHDAVDDECWEDPSCEDVVPYPFLQNRMETRRKPGVGEVPWTNANGTPDKSDEDQSSVVHLAGFFVTHCSANVHKQLMTCQSRESEFFVGWSEDLEPPTGRPISG